MLFARQSAEDGKGDTAMLISSDKFNGLQHGRDGSEHTICSVEFDADRYGVYEVKGHLALRTTTWVQNTYARIRVRNSNRTLLYENVIEFSGIFGERSGDKQVNVPFHFLYFGTGAGESLSLTVQWNDPIDTSRTLPGAGLWVTQCDDLAEDDGESPN